MNYILNYQTWKRLFEQAESEKSKYGEYAFGQAFADNMITPQATSYAPEIAKMKEDLAKAIKEGKQLKDIKIKIESSASSRPATSIPPKGFTKLDHNYDGKAPNNQFLATNRGLKLKEVLLKELPAAGIPVTDANFEFAGGVVSTSPDASEQYVRVKIAGLFEKPIPPKEEETPKYKYSIQYNWYKIGEDNLPYVLIGRSDGPGKEQYKGLRYYDIGRGKTKLDQTFVDAVNSSGEEIKIAGYAHSDPDELFFYAFGTFGKYDAVSNSGNVFYYNNEADWLADARAISIMDPDNIPSSGVKKITGPASSQYEIVSDIFAGSGTWNPNKSGKIVFEHGAGANIPGKTIYLLKPKTGEAQTDKKGIQNYGKVSAQNIYQLKGAKPKVTKTSSTPSLKK